ncbi:hypothetical protein PFICI_14429 [Pestalotiopsis fici W106-1]|uniref:Uncharacterized protein n=1 Tax=Pestalotiopsis fici (strain W106-1 / CGMCC3.15140) TaxID=1229662 RepID=W3WHW0_PESFW|nr:uncharacterized protein PFICI_14429 [Pestalotiopsis fici W106-1]ETS73483.1 hypothetical protein PFICI_14429 [Pestalotiopsis fici W106-1]
MKSVYAIQKLPGHFSWPHSKSDRQGEWYKVFAFPDYRFPGPLSVVNAKEKIHSAKYLSQGFLQHNVLRSESQIDEVLRGLFGWFDHAAENQKSMELGDFFSYAAYDITGEITFSKTFGFIEKGEDIGGAIANNEAIELFLTVFGFFRWISYVFCNPLTTWMELLPIGHLGAITKSALEERKKNPDARFDICAHWYRALGKAGDVNLVWDEGRLFAAAMSNLGAGSDTLSCSLQSLIYHVIREPRVWKRLQDEVGEAVKQGYCMDPVVSHDDAQRLPYLQAAIKEALRIFAPVPMGLPRVAPKGGVKIGGVFFPEGTVLSVNPYVLMRDKEIWGPDADEFNPDRWFEPDAALLEKHFCPWGLGWASCPGQHIARIQLSKIGATMMRDYEFKQVQPGKEWEWMAYFICVPKHWPVYISKRRST